MVEVHKAAQTGYSRASSIYVSGRPGYPTEVNSWLRNTLGICAGKLVVDLGAGTGKFTTHLIQTGADVTAVEPVRPMLDELRRAFPSANAKEGSANRIPLNDETVDVVICAQAFHWFATSETLNEIKRVLKPKGILGLVWNVRDETSDWVAALSQIMRPYEEGTPRFYKGQWRSVFPAEGFTALKEVQFKHSHRGDFETVVVDRIMSVSFIASLPPSSREKVKGEIRRLLHSHPDLGNGADVKFPYLTLAAWIEKL